MATFCDEDFKGKTALPNAAAVLNKNNMCKRFHSLLGENLKIQAKYDALMSKLEADSEAEKAENYDKRAETISKLMTPANGDGPQKSIYFWLNVFKTTELRNHIKSDDIPVLQSLYDIRTRVHADVPGRHFVLEFYFEPNKYFSNRVLKKSYFFKDMDEMPVLLEYDGFKIYRCEGCRIDWSKEESELRKEKQSWSFFDFFDPPTMPVEETDDNQDEFRLKKYKLKQDFLIGCYIKEQLLPKAMLFFFKGLKEGEDGGVDQHGVAKNAENAKKASAAGSADFYEVVVKDCEVYCVGSGDINYEDAYETARRKVIQSSHPVCNTIMLFGVIICLTSVILLGIDGRFVSPDEYPKICQARAWLLSTGFTLAYGAMFSKVWRVHRFTTKAKSDPKKKVEPWKLYTMVSGLLSVDLVILIAWQIFDPLQRILETFPLEDPVSTTDDIKIRPELEHCESDRNSMWLGLVYGFKGLILVFGLFLAYETRSIKVKQINDSRYVGMSIYNVVVLCLITAPVGMVIASQQDASFAFIALAVIFCCFLSMLLIFVPKVIEVIRHPKDKAESKYNPDSGISKEDEERYQKLVTENEELQRLISQKEEKIRLLRQRLAEREAAQKVAEMNGQSGIIPSAALTGTLTPGLNASSSTSSHLTASTPAATLAITQDTHDHHT